MIEPDEQFGDGIMSAIDFRTSVERKPDPKGDRVVIVMDGKVRLIVLISLLRARWKGTIAPRQRWKEES